MLSSINKWHTTLEYITWMCIIASYGAFLQIQTTSNQTLDWCDDSSKSLSVFTALLTNKGLNLYLPTDTSIVKHNHAKANLFENNMWHNGKGDYLLNHYWIERKRTYFLHNKSLQIQACSKFQFKYLFWQCEGSEGLL